MAAIILPRDPYRVSTMFPTALEIMFNRVRHKQRMDIIDRRQKDRELEIKAGREFALEQSGHTPAQPSAPEGTPPEVVVPEMGSGGPVRPDVTVPGGKSYMRPKIEVRGGPGGAKIITGVPPGSHYVPAPTERPGTPPKTAMAAFLDKNPNATNDEIIAFAQKLKGTSFSMELADGTKIKLGGGQELTPATQSKLQKETVGLLEQLGNLNAIKENVFKEALTFQGQVKGKALRFADYMKMPISEKNKEFLGKTRYFIESLEQTFNAYRKEVTGAQAAIKELKMLRDSIINKKLTPTELDYSLDRYESQVKRSLRLKRMLMREGIAQNEVGRQLDGLIMSGADVPDSEIDARGDELVRSGLTKGMVIQKLRIEGYIE